MRLLPCFWGAELARAMAWHAGHRAMPQLEAQAASLRDDVSRAGAEFAAHASFRFGIALSRCGATTAAIGAALSADCAGAAEFADRALTEPNLSIKRLWAPLWKEIAVDADALVQDLSPQRLSAMPLCSDPAAAPLGKWQTLQGLLVGSPRRKLSWLGQRRNHAAEHWFVWKDSYQARLDGAEPWSNDIEFARLAAIADAHRCENLAVSFNARMATVMGR